MIKLSSLTGRPAHLGGCYHCKGGTKMCICPGRQYKPGTPNMFAEYRVEVVSHGPAFIPAEHLNSRVTLDEAAAIIGDGYVWHAATDYTGAGWVRPRGRPA